jgi:hypothetical protein
VAPDALVAPPPQPFVPAEAQIDASPVVADARAAAMRPGATRRCSAQRGRSHLILTVRGDSSASTRPTFSDHGGGRFLFISRCRSFGGALMPGSRRLAAIASAEASVSWRRRSSYRWCMQRPTA